MTTTEQDTLLEDAAVNLRVAAAQVSRRYRQFTTYSDLYQEGVWWVLAHPATTQARLDDGRRGSTRLTGQLAKHVSGLARREKAAQSGYAPEDEAFYSRATVEAALPSVWDTALMGVPPAAEGADFQKQKSDPSTSGTWLAVCVDVRGAWDRTRMPGTWREALQLRFRDGFRNYQVADMLHVADSTAHTYIAKGLRSLVDALGGPPPGWCADDCECRRVLSNGQAAAVTARGYEQ